MLTNGQTDQQQSYYAVVAPQGAFMQVKTLDLIKPVEPATFNVIYQKKSVPSYNTLNSMRRVLNQLSAHAQPPHTTSHSMNQTQQQIRMSSDHQQSLKDAKSIIMEALRNRKAQGDLNIINQQQRGGLVHRQHIQQQQRQQNTSTEVIKPSSSQHGASQHKNTPFPTPPEAPRTQQPIQHQSIKEVQQQLHNSQSFRQHNSRSIAQLKNHVKLIDTQKFKTNEILAKRQNQVLKSHQPKAKQNKLAAGGKKVAAYGSSTVQSVSGVSAMTYESNRNEPFILITGEFGTPMHQDKETPSTLTEISPRQQQSSFMGKPVALYNFVNTQSQIGTQDYMQVIRQRCENRGISSNPAMVVPGGHELAQTPRRNISITPGQQSTITQSQTVQVVQQQHSTSSANNPNGSVEDSIQVRQVISDLSRQCVRRKSVGKPNNPIVVTKTLAPNDPRNMPVKVQTNSQQEPRSTSRINFKIQKPISVVKSPPQSESKVEPLAERIYSAMRNMKDQVPLPPVTAEAWCIFDTDTEKLLTGKLVNHKRECASLTKMMTFLVSWQVFQKNFPELTDIDIKIPKYCTQVNGTTAFLRKRDTLTLHQLFHALLLPSGNDAALVLADFFGGVLMSKSETQNPPKSFAFVDNMNVRFFLREMNVVGGKLGMGNTVFDSPHGLANSVNVSTASEMAILSYHCMQSEVFSEVVKTPYYEVQTELAYYEWQNTNRLLGYDFDSEDTVPLFTGTLGCKTGVTPTAGPCFSGCFSKYDNDQVEPDNCIVIVLGSKSMEARWLEVPALVRWYQKLKSQAIKSLDL